MPTTFDLSQSRGQKKPNLILENFKQVYFSLRTPPFSLSSAKLTFSQLNSIVTIFWRNKYRFWTTVSILSLYSAAFVLTRV